jgi:PAS domain S-box-containing protein
MPEKQERNTVLIVDDNPDILRLLFLYLQNAGFKVLVAENGHRALERLKISRPDIILLDVLMPEMDGFETISRLKADRATKDIPVIFLTALTDTMNKVKGFELGAVDYIAKPTQNEEVIARVNTHLTLRRLRIDLAEQNQRLKEENLKRRRVQDALRESRERYRFLAENSTDMIARQRPDGVYLYMSPACEVVLGYKVEEMVGRSELDFANPDDVLIVEEAVGNVNNPKRSAKISYQYRARHKHGHYVWLETTSTLIRDENTGTALEIIAVSRNVTDRKAAEEALQKAHDLLEIRVQERTAELVALNAATERFVPHEFLGNLGKNSIIDVELGDQVKRAMTVLIADLRSFTTLSEKMGPQKTFNFLNTFFGRISPIIREHKGFIDKYIGDAVMALFPENADDALLAAIAIQRDIPKLNHELQKDGFPAIWCGAGIHTGDLMLGTIGEPKRLETTVISDSVNLAFRLEGLTKMYGAQIIVSEDALFALDTPSRYKYRYVDRVLVKGKLEPVSVFEIFHDGFPEAQQKLDTLEYFERGLLHYHSQEFVEAKQRFEQVLLGYPRDKVSQIYLRRIHQFVENGVAPDWEGVANPYGEEQQWFTRK